MSQSQQRRACHLVSQWGLFVIVAEDDTACREFSSVPSSLPGVFGRAWQGGHYAWSGWGTLGRQTFFLPCGFGDAGTAHRSERNASRNPPTCIYKVSHLLDSGGRNKDFSEHTPTGKTLLSWLEDHTCAICLKTAIAFKYICVIVTFNSFISYLCASSCGPWDESSWSKSCCSSHGDKRDCVRGPPLAAVGHIFAPIRCDEAPGQWQRTLVHHWSPVLVECRQEEQAAEGQGAWRDPLPPDPLQGRPEQKKPCVLLVCAAAAVACAPWWLLAVGVAADCASLWQRSAQGWPKKRQEQCGSRQAQARPEHLQLGQTEAYFYFHLSLKGFLGCLQTEQHLGTSQCKLVL